MDLFERISEISERGTEIPKPEATEAFAIKGWGKRRNETALIYSIPNKQGGNRYEKGITRSEFDAAFTELQKSSKFTREWFNENLTACAKEGACNFTTIGGIFTLLGEATYKSRGIYLKL